MTQTLTQKSLKVALLSTCITAINVVLKLVSGIYSGSISVLSEGIQSGIDLLTSLGIYTSIRISAEPPDQDHPYGHGKAEFLMNFVQVLLIIFSAIYVLSRAYHRLLHPEPIRVDYGIAALLISILTNGFLIAKLKQTYKITKSKALEMEAYHLTTDIIASTGILAGLVLLYFTGWHFLDNLIAIIFILFILFMSTKRLKDVIHLLMDGALSTEDLFLVKKVLDTHLSVKGYHKLRSRSIGRMRYIELHVQLSDTLSFIDAHAIAEEIEDKIASAIGNVIVSLHYEPYEAEKIIQEAKNLTLKPQNEKD